MTDISITAANVVAGAGAKKSQGIAGETITAGQAIYKDPTSGKYMKADSNSGTAEARVPDGIALHGASNNQPIALQTGGPITIGATLTPGAAYYLSDTPGGICPVADIGSGEYVCLIGLATSASVLSINIEYTGVAN